MSAHHGQKIENGRQKRLRKMEDIQQKTLANCNRIGKLPGVEGKPIEEELYTATHQGLISRAISGQTMNKAKLAHHGNGATSIE